MLSVYKIKKGLNIDLVGEATKSMKIVPQATHYAVRPDDFYGITPKLLAKEGDKVDIGTALFTDKETEMITIVSPISGTIEKIERGERRKILYIHIKSDNQNSHQSFDNLPFDKSDKNSILECLLKTGLFAYIKQRPYDIVANPNDTPKAIFISAFSKMPLASDFSFIVKGQEKDFAKGIEILSKIAPTYLGISPQQIDAEFINEIRDKINLNVFDGPNPSGNVGVQINHISPINKGEIVWTIKPEEIIYIGRLYRTKRINLTKRFAVSGAMVNQPEYMEAIQGTPFNNILEQKISSDNKHIRIIDGNPLVGKKVSMEDFLGAHTSEICVLPEGDNINEPFGWILPRLQQFSISRSYFSWLFKNKKYNLDCRIKGGKRHMIMSTEYDRVFPMNILPEFLIKAIITGNIDRQEELGIYEVAPEDFALPEFVDSSKLELQRIVREGLDLLRKENA